LDLNLGVDEFVDQDLHPVETSVSEISPGFSNLTRGNVEKGHLHLNVVGAKDSNSSEIIFSRDTEFGLPLLRRLADVTHFPDAGEIVKVYDSLRRRFVRVHATRSLRKEIVSGRHQFVTVWKFDNRDRSWEVWVDGYGGVVREELGGPHMVALRADADAVAAYARGEGDDDGMFDLSLEYENIPQAFSLARPNLSWSVELPEEEGPLNITLLNPTLQASVDVVVIENIESALEPESIVLDLLDRMRRKCPDLEILYQQPRDVGGVKGVRFETIGQRKGTELRTIGIVTVNRNKAYALMAAAPVFRFKEAREQMERILKSFVAKNPENRDQE